MGRFASRSAGRIADRSIEGLRAEMSRADPSDRISASLPTVMRGHMLVELTLATALGSLVLATVLTLYAGQRAGLNTAFDTSQAFRMRATHCSDRGSGSQRNAPGSRLLTSDRVWLQRRAGRRTLGSPPVWPQDTKIRRRRSVVSAATSPYLRNGYLLPHRFQAMRSKVAFAACRSNCSGSNPSPIQVLRRCPSSLSGSSRSVVKKFS